MDISTKSIYAGKRILVTQNQLINFAGSEIVTLEIVKYFARNGAQVLLATNALGDPMMTKIKAISGVKIYILPNKKLEDSLTMKPVDIAWIHHQLIPKSLFLAKSLKYTKYIFHHMSGLHPTEFPIFSSLESSIADTILFNSPETRDKITSQGVLLDAKAPKEVFGNPSPDIFLRVGKKRKNKKGELRKVLIVTNHLVPELLEARSILQERGVEVVTYGAQTDTYKLLEPSDFKDIDTVITIGKTVQYAILYGIPVYCYDHFGGPGYISKDNYEESFNRNFSGRNGVKKDSSVIADEIINQYSEANEFFIEMEDSVINNFRLSIKMDSLCQRMFTSENDKDRIQVSKTDIVGLSKVNELNAIIQEILRRTDREYYELKVDRDGLHQIYLGTLNQLEEEREVLSALRRSMSYRVGKLVTYPIRKIKRIISR